MKMLSHNYKMLLLAAALLAWLSAWLPLSNSNERGGGLSARTNDSRRQFVLQADAFWRLRPPHNERFDASALAWRKDQLLTLNDRGPELYEIVLGEKNEGELRKTKLIATADVMKASLARKGRGGRFDCEGMALDESGNIYICEEAQRLIFRASPDGGTIEALPIDWSAARKYFLGGANASFEGVAVGGGKLFVANERENPRVLVVDLETKQLEETFFVDSLGFAIGGPHYSDLAYYDGSLFVLDRNHRCILEVDPKARKVVAEHSFGTMEISNDHAYVTEYPTGTMEGLAVDDKYFWLVTDNNGLGRFAAKSDIRPTLFRCVRPRK